MSPVGYYFLLPLGQVQSLEKQPVANNEMELRQASHLQTDTNASSSLLPQNLGWAVVVWVSCGSCTT